MSLNHAGRILPRTFRTLAVGIISATLAGTALIIPAAAAPTSTTATTQTTVTASSDLTVDQLAAADAEGNSGKSNTPGEMAVTYGTLKGGEWKKVVSGWGKFNRDHIGSINGGRYFTGEYKCYVDGVRISHGSLSGHFTLVVVGYGSCFFWSPNDTSYVIY
ncbi:hypothetical protein [Streptomyces chryseus]